MSERVTLTPHEMRTAANEGVLRRLRRITGKANADVFEPKDRWGTDIEAAAAEIAFAKARGLYWQPSEGPQPPEQGDVAGYEVRLATKPDGPLTVYRFTADDKLCVLVVGKCPVFHIVGYLYAREAKRPEFWRDFANNRDGGAYLVPQNALSPISPLTAVAA